MPRHLHHDGARWSASEDRRLLKLHRDEVPGADIARALGRTRPAIYQRLTNLRARRKRPRR